MTARELPAPVATLALRLFKALAQQSNPVQRARLVRMLASLGALVR